MTHDKTILRRYTPPTCTLELIAKPSALSRWAGQPVLKNLRFRLYFDDPRLPDDRQVALQGDRAQLEALSEAVETYVQNFLAQSPARLNAALFAPSFNPADGSSDRSKALEPLAHSPSAISPERSPESIYLQPDSSVQADSAIAAPTAHYLFLGPLETESSGAAIRLSALQLFDLATALDEYAADALALPNLTRPSSQRRTFPSSLRFAASFLLALGITTYSVKLLGDFYAGSNPATTASNEAATDPEQIALRPAPTVLPSPQTGNQTLPPPPPVGAIKPASPEDLEEIPVSSEIPEQASAPPPAAESAPSAASQAPAIAIPAEPTTPEIADAVPNDPPPPAPPATIQSLPEVAPAPAPEQETAGSTTSALARSAAPSSSSSEVPAASRTATAFDRIPQVAEVRSYFQERWTPPESLDTTIEYSLVLSQNGSLQQIIPLGQNAETFLDRTGMPLLGEKFVSSVDSGIKPTIRLVLSPDGEVKTFLEGIK